jgi:hypothetical protein
LANCFFIIPLSSPLLTYLPHSGQHCPLDKLPQHHCAIFRFDQSPQILAVNRRDAQWEFAVAQPLLMKRLGEPLGADQEAERAMAAAIFELAITRSPSPR